MRNRLSTFISIILVIFILVPSTFNSQFNVIDALEYEQLNDSILQSFNATSSDEYFNESTYPRYPLVTKPITMIIYPHKGYPAMIQYDEVFDIIINTTSDTSNWELYLNTTESSIVLDILNTKFVNGLWYVTVQPSSNIAGLYDLQLNCSTGSDYQTHAVRIFEEKSYPFKFIHISDTHFPSYDVYNTTDINLRNFEDIKEQDVDFVLFTGDLINGPSWMFVDPITQLPLAVEVGLKLALWALDTLDLPVYVIGGNHDLDASTLVPDDPTTIWRKYFGRNPVINYTYMDWLFSGFGSSRDGLTQDEYNYLKTTISFSPNSPNVLFYHSNYKDQATSIRNSYRIELMLQGHEHHESLSINDNTLYFCQAPMFYNASTVFMVLNKSHIELKETIYDFSPLLIEVTESSFSLPILTLTFILSIVIVLKRRKQTLHRL